MNLSTTYFALTIDPLHVGAGGYRLGRVDNTIVRDPGTNIPKVPGSSISGVCRNYAIYSIKGDEQKKAVDCAKNGNKKIKNNCGTCVICQTFGFASGEKKEGKPTNQIGRVKFFDGRIVAFPVSTMVGPVWVTTASVLKELGHEVAASSGSEELMVNFDVPGSPARLNLGWLYLPVKKENTLSLPSAVGNTAQIKEISSRLVVAPDALFPEIVNSNLEVRTSVSIDFETGAASEGMLFTYEAIPRATLLAFDVVIDAYRCDSSTRTESQVNEVVKGGLRLFKTLGLGGMNTRGFGRMDIINLS